MHAVMGRALSRITCKHEHKTKGCAACDWHAIAKHGIILRHNMWRCIDFVEVHLMELVRRQRAASVNQSFGEL